MLDHARYTFPSTDDYSHQVDIVVECGRDADGIKVTIGDSVVWLTGYDAKRLGQAFTLLSETQIENDFKASLGRHDFRAHKPFTFAEPAATRGDIERLGDRLIAAQEPKNVTVSNTAEFRATA